MALPFEIIEDILLCLPVKSLIRFKCVSKEWYTLISSRNFVKLHLSQTLLSNNYQHLIISHSAPSSLSSANISSKNDSDIQYTELDHPYKHLKQVSPLNNPAFNSLMIFPTILGSCNGVVCFSLYDKSSILLYNPSTKSHRSVRHFTSSPNINPHLDVSPDLITMNLVFYGFGHDTARDDYKLVRMIEKREYDVLEYREASVYSVSNDSWKCVTDQTTTDFCLWASMGVFFNECLHFLMVGREYPYKPISKCFNLQTETFSFVNFPKFDKKFLKMNYRMAELGGCFCVLVNYHTNVDVDVDHYSELELVHSDLWMMKEYGNTDSWLRLFSIPDPAKLGDFNCTRPVVYSRDRERVLLELGDSNYFWYDFGSKRFEKVTVHGWPSGHDTTGETWTFVDSLVSLGKDKVTDKGKFKANTVLKKIKKKRNVHGFLSSGFKLKL